jgi:hypothetical protein
MAALLRTVRAYTAVVVHACAHPESDLRWLTGEALRDASGRARRLAPAVIVSIFWEAAWADIELPAVGAVADQSGAANDG